MIELVLATRNPHKVRELTELLAGLPVKLLSAVDTDAPEVIEDRDTLAGNAAKKAVEVATATGRFAIADDTGLEVDALDGAPGVHTARFAGPDATYADNNQKLLGALEGLAPAARTARFRCVIALARPTPGGAEVLDTVEGVLEGRIATAASGDHGFGYDPIFEVDQGTTLAALDGPEKNAISHRGRALQALRSKLEARFAHAPAT